MGEVVLVLGVPHTPLLWRLMGDDVPDDLRGVAAGFARARTLLQEARPDAMILVASDHFRQYLLSTMPAFLVGKADEMRGTHPNEERAFGLPAITVPGDRELALHLLGGSELTPHFDFAFSDEPWLDHAFVVPLLYLDPGLEVPLVPVHTNANAPPIPRAGRFHELGSYLREAVHRLPGARRVAVVTTGHLAYEIGGPRHFLGRSPDPAFDEEAVGWLRRGAADEAVAACSYQRLLAAGNITHQYLNFLTALGAAGGRPADVAEGVACRFGNEPFFAWGAG